MWRKIVVDRTFASAVRYWRLPSRDLPEDGTAPREAAATAFGNWTSVLAQSLRENGATEADAHGVAVLIVAAVEGSVGICRAQRSTEPLDQIVAQLESVVVAVTAR
ncbi:hypothetical protein ACGFK1_11490 [Mycobacterium sp. NPDC048908]|uniref:LmrA/YxaF family transcription factor n=1 Tax=Mycobacterium sp. NPDC048908 TaxID=3364292 RepID=UPI00371174BA